MKMSKRNKKNILMKAVQILLIMALIFLIVLVIYLNLRMDIEIWQDDTLSFWAKLKLITR